MTNFDEKEEFGAESQTPTFPGGNERERLVISSGRVLVIDQFMLANQQFITPLSNTADDSSAVEALVAKFGGLVIGLSEGVYAVYRHAQERFMVVYPCDSTGDGADPVSPFRARKELPTGNSLGAITIDTRAVVLVDLAKIQDGRVRGEYLRLWQGAQRKEARDFLRTQGAAVRYGFSHYSDVVQVSRGSERTLVLSAQYQQRAENSSDRDGVAA